jgi:hypothetical protein
MKKQTLIDIINNNALNSKITSPPAIRFFVHGGQFRTNSIPSLDDYKDDYVIVRNVAYEFDTSFYKEYPVIALEYDKIIGATRK